MTGRRPAHPLKALLRGPLKTLGLPATLAVFVTAGAPHPLAGQLLVVDLQPESITVGDRVTATLTLTAPGSAVAGAPRFPDWREAWGDAEILETGPVERLQPSAAPAAPSGSVGWRQRLVLTSFRTGEIALPPRAVSLPLARDRSAGRREGAVEVRTPADLTLTVTSVLPPGTDPGQAELAPAAPPQPLPAGSRFWWTLATAALLAVATVVTAVARRPRGTFRPPRRTTPLEALLESLRDLSTETSAERGHEGLSLALRRYLGKSLGFAAVESTTTEVKLHLRRQGVPPELVLRAHEVLEACDRVKFACEPADRTALTGRIDAVREIARELAARGECTNGGADGHHRPPDGRPRGPEGNGAPNRGRP